MMKLLRISVSLLACSAFALLAACGGGGGGTTPPTSPGGAPPPTTGTPTPAPSASPTAAPTSTPAPGVGVSSTVETAYDTVVNGTDNWQTNGVTDSDTGDGDTSSGGSGSNTVDGIPCGLNSESQMTSNNYHVHAFVGIMVNGTQYAMPDAIGMQGPGSGEPILNFTCAYYIHTHGASGVIHVEDPTITGTYQTVQPPSQYNLQSLFDIWGQSMASLPITGVAGNPVIYTGTPSSKLSNGDDLVNSYTLSTASPSSILLSHHMVIWLVYGTPPSAGLPQIDWAISN